MPTDWDIKSMEHTCSKCEKPFHDKETCFSVLDFTEEGYMRSDYCPDCWIQVSKEQSPFSVWQTLYREPLPAPEETLKHETAESLLRKLMEKDDDSKNAVRYILAVMLERKRILTERDVKKTEHGETIRIYEHKKTGETFVIPDPDLKLDQLEQVQRQVAGMLS